MASTKIVDMTLDDIKALITEVVDEKLHNWWQQSRDTRSIEEVLASMDRLRWTPPPGSPSTTELLLEALKKTLGVSSDAKGKIPISHCGFKLFILTVEL